VSPNTSTFYSIWGIKPSGCKSASATLVMVSVKPTPTITIQSSNNLPCAGDQLTLTAVGASSYSWASGSSTNSLVIVPAFPTMYTVSGADQECGSSAYFLQNVLGCTTLEMNDRNEIIVFPNPATDRVNITLDNYSGDIKLEILSVTGQTLLSNALQKNDLQISVADLRAGVYMIVLRKGEEVVALHKLVIE
jgi:hypothetical protein